MSMNQPWAIVGMADVWQYRNNIFEVVAHRIIITKLKLNETRLIYTEFRNYKYNKYIGVVSCNRDIIILCSK